MIQSNELMIGNWLEYFTDFGDSLGFRKIKAHEFLSIHDNPKRVKPIPLTEEILLKSPETKKSTWITDMWTIRDPKGQFHVVKMKGRFIFRGLGMSVVYVNTLHHLQNLVFVNTGQELKIEL